MSWIGTTAIWLSKNFTHVIAVEPDQRSLECLRSNLNASKCFNVTICEQPIAKTTEFLIFGPRNNTLNESTSSLKDGISNSNDYEVQSITFNQLIQSFIYEKEDIKNKKISFIKCDIEAGEENILEDILYFAYHNNVKIYLSFHLDWWKNKNLERFEPLFKLFKTNCPIHDIVNYIKHNPFTSILFEPLENN